ncbi:reverse transcriptase zinc-binding domain-containing protein [Artemisia annua]|uniref:Reverse transcriptase zinc-binding domain-containing protein n=1 Tax=Artemisia annua TaxID=35608 RepID=A0A2U1KSA3_ARTAN|nr:reverse transcriptase zinc-binding domain-containing protein [Artemisia annua]
MQSSGSADMYGGGSTSVKWKWKQRPVDREELEQLVLLNRVVVESSSVLTSRPDKWIWNGNADGKFAVAEVKKFLVSGVDASNNLVLDWCKWVPIKCNVFVWRAALGGIPTSVSLLKRHVPIADIGCQICGYGDESIEHLFFSCLVASVVWQGISQWCKGPNIFAFSFGDLLELHNFVGLKGIAKEVFQGIIRIGCWSLWKARNELRFSNKAVRPSDILSEVKSFVFGGPDFGVAHGGFLMKFTVQKKKEFKQVLCAINLKRFKHITGALLIFFVIVENVKNTSGYEPRFDQAFEYFIRDRFHNFKEKLIQNLNQLEKLLNGEELHTRDSKEALKVLETQLQSIFNPWLLNQLEFIDAFYQRFWKQKWEREQIEKDMQLKERELIEREMQLNKTGSDTSSEQQVETSSPGYELDVDGTHRNEAVWDTEDDHIRPSFDTEILATIQHSNNNDNVVVFDNVNITPTTPYMDPNGARKYEMHEESVKPLLKQKEELEVGYREAVFREKRSIQKLDEQMVLNNIKVAALLKEISDLKRENSKLQKITSNFEIVKTKFENENQQFFKRANDLEAKLRKTGQTVQTFQMMLPKDEDVNQGKFELGLENTDHLENNLEHDLKNEKPCFLNKVQKLTPSLYDAEKLGKGVSTDVLFNSEDEEKSEEEKRLKIKQRKTPFSYHGFVYGCTQLTEVKKNLKDEIEPRVKDINLTFDCFEKYLVTEMREDLKYIHSLGDEFDEKCLILDIQKEFFTTQIESFKKINELSKEVVDVKEELSKRTAQFEKDLTKLEAQSISFQLKLQEKKMSSENSLTSVLKGKKRFLRKIDDAKIKFDFDQLDTKNIELKHAVTSLQKEEEHLKETYKNLFDSIKRSRVHNQISNKSDSQIAKNHRIGKENCVLQKKIIELEKILAQQAKDFDDAKTNFSIETDKYEKYFAHLEDQNVSLHEKVASQDHLTIRNNTII